ncbi:S66 peptidase family protein [Botrimarina mediterranea]|uniref:Putative murein peptide carboxypeptidase n=1 Tax=Botrimarina mediterranea TaxID=2528022 RepID=A0A518K6D8_9BACT|nr:LD-carboxypeptidase [Botrimarina mediterranea]QDV73359.1 putative murein peptide carboxypeptidase [Botrimarina mediterranea]QDV77876.1 putative murein peptide carboxypeptidase [Planctomycetes bacterium K2D]
MMTRTLLALGLSFVCLASTAAEPTTKPAGLKPGDTVMIVAPSGDLDEERIELAVERLKELGFKVIVPEDVYSQWGYLAGSDQRRADEFMKAFTDPEVDAVFPGTGGYGVMRMLDLLDFDKIRDNPKVLIGFSDITALHMALAKKCNLVTFHSPNPQWGLGSDEGFPAYNAKYFWRCLMADQNDGDEGFTYETPDGAPLRVIAPGVAEGTLCGGNLTLVASLTGTEYELDTEGRVLFLEDVRESPYRIDRMLRQLKLSGQLDKPAAVILGQFSKCESDGDGSSLALAEVLLDYFADATYPVVYNFPAGHVKDNATLPLGVRARVDANQRRVSVLENAVSAP